MKRGQREALLVVLAEEMLGRGSWCGETHLQKGTFLLQAVLKVDLGFDFILYKHGPFSFELRDDLASMTADGILEAVVRHPGYGLSYIPTEFSKSFLLRFPRTVDRHKQQATFVAEQMGEKGVAELERLATAIFLLGAHPDLSSSECAYKLNELKPHIPLLEARDACAQGRALVQQSKSYI